MSTIKRNLTRLLPAALLLGACGQLPLHATPTLSTIYNFGGVSGDPANPECGLIQASDGSLYGASSAGGSIGTGSIYKITTSGVEAPIYNFSTFNSSFENADGARPIGGLLQASDGNLYGTTYLGGTNGQGTVFSVTTAGSLTSLHSFSALDPDDNNPEGAWPFASLIQASDGNLYGTTANGGSEGNGTVFQITTAGIITPLHLFDFDDGSIPWGGVIQASDGYLYGTTYIGGDDDAGTLFQMDLSGDITQNISFNSYNGNDPEASLIQASDGNLYGTTNWGGSTTDVNGFGYGAIFKFAQPSDPTAFYSFSAPDVGGDNSDGYYPIGGLVEASDGNFYGTTEQGGASNDGTVFRIDPSGVLTTLYSFGGSDGQYPFGTLTQASDGNLYGTTYAGGSSGQGTVFKVTLDAAGSVPLADLTLNKTTIIGGRSTVGRVKLASRAPVGGEVVALYSSDPTSATVPATVTVPAGSKAATFTVTGEAVQADAGVTIWANAGGATVTTNLEVTFAIDRVAFNPATVTGGDTFETKVKLSAPALIDTTITFTSSNTSVVPTPASIVIPAGRTKGSVLCSTRAVSASTPVNIEAESTSAGDLTATMTVVP